MMQTGKYIIEDYLKELSSKAPVPGGGGAAALTAATGASLAMMVCSLTVGKKRYADVEEEIRALASKAELMRDRFLKFADDDAEAFLPLSAAYSMKRDTEEEKNARDEVMQKALLAAAEVPLSVLHLCCEAAPLFEELIEKGSRLALSDVGVGILMLRAAAESAGLNVMINTKLMKDVSRRDEMNGRVRRMTETVSAMSDKIYGAVREKVES